MQTEQFTIPRNAIYSSLEDLTVTIECDPLAPTSNKLGLAVRASLASGANLRGANLSGADLSGADLSGADLRSADLYGADLSGADLRSADLSGADLTGANLSGADLRSADLCRADLYGVNLSVADLRSADLYGADLSGALIHNEPVNHLITQVNRQIDPYTFLAFRMQDQSVKVLAGCRWFSIQEFRDHAASTYADTPKAVETLDILDFIELRASREPAQ